MIDIKDKITDQEKAGFENLRVEVMVLEQLLQEKKNQQKWLLTNVFQKLNYNPNLYALEFNAGKDKWNVKLIPGVLDMPNRQERRHPIIG